nr:retrovirus-related Pol polyprotein from transposon TNT 1-94 [Tanacetum cinerariifolium]
MYLMVCTRPDIAYAEAIWLKGLLEELGVELNRVTVNCDNQAAIHLSRNHVFYERTKHINVRYHFIREVLEAKTVEVLNVGTKHNAADALTNVVPGHKLQHCFELLSVDCIFNFKACERALKKVNIFRGEMLEEVTSKGGSTKVVFFEAIAKEVEDVVLDSHRSEMGGCERVLRFLVCPRLFLRCVTQPLTPFIGSVSRSELNFFFLDIGSLTMEVFAGTEDDRLMCLRRDSDRNKVVANQDKNRFSNEIHVASIAMKGSKSHNYGGKPDMTIQEDGQREFSSAITEVKWLQIGWISRCMFRVRLGVGLGELAIDFSITIINLVVSMLESSDVTPDLLDTNADGVEPVFKRTRVRDTKESREPEPLALLILFPRNENVFNPSLFCKDLLHDQVIPVGWELCKVVRDYFVEVLFAVGIVTGDVNVLVV